MTGRIEHTKVTSHGFFTQIRTGVRMSPFLTTHNKDTESSRSTKHIFSKTLMASEAESQRLLLDGALRSFCGSVKRSVLYTL